MKQPLYICLWLVFFAGIFLGVWDGLRRTAQREMPALQANSLASEWHRLAVKQGIKRIDVLTEFCDVRIEYVDAVKCIGLGHGEEGYTLIGMKIDEPLP